jgi:succinate dehydrogenase / fumarate reductase iron-sulfur subunit
MHPIDTADRTSNLKNEGGIGYCNITKCCSEVCPEHIKITDNAIIPLKERVADKYYDPIQMVWRKVTGKRDPLPMVDMPVLPGGPPDSTTAPGDRG